MCLSNMAVDKAHSKNRRQMQPTRVLLQPRAASNTSVWQLGCGMRLVAGPVVRSPGAANAHGTVPQCAPNRTHWSHLKFKNLI